MYVFLNNLKRICFQNWLDMFINQCWNFMYSFGYEHIVFYLQIPDENPQEVDRLTQPQWDRETDHFYQYWTWSRGRSHNCWCIGSLQQTLSYIKGEQIKKSKSWNKIVSGVVFASKVLRLPNKWSSPFYICMLWTRILIIRYLKFTNISFFLILRESVNSSIFSKLYSIESLFKVSRELCDLSDDPLSRTLTKMFKITTKPLVGICS